MKLFRLELISQETKDILVQLDLNDEYNRDDVLAAVSDIGKLDVDSYHLVGEIIGIPKTLSLEAQKEYIENNGIACPFCKTKDHLEGGCVDVLGGTASQNVRCLFCDHSWTDLYRLQGIVDGSAEDKNGNIILSGS